jgi:hypothetical protein
MKNIKLYFINIVKKRAKVVWIARISTFARFFQNNYKKNIKKK